MGCTTSKQALRDLQRSPSPLALPRSHSFPARGANGDINGHVVVLASSTVGSLELDKAVTWPETAATATTSGRKLVPRTPTMTPPNEPEAIDARALMSGLEEYSPAPALAPAPAPSPAFTRHSFSFPIATAQQEVSTASSKVTPLPLSTKLASKTGEKATKPRKAVLYFTTLRGVRATYEDCCLARAILRGYGVRVDERDVSMHRGFRDELHGLRGPARCRPGAGLPSLFVDGELVGGADDLKRLHEAGELAAPLAGCDTAATGEASACEACGDMRFVLCEVCSGSCKVFVDEEEEEEEVFDGGAGFRRCPECNENGIVRCPICCC